MYRFYIYGAGQYYNEFSCHISSLLEKGEILGIITTLKQSFEYMDGYKCITIDEMDDDFDYVIIAVEKFKEILALLYARGIGDEKIILSRAFKIPNFNLTEYIKLKKSNVSILSNYCLGGRIYRELGLKRLSPTVNMFCYGNDYIRFLKDYKKYLCIDMKSVDELLENDKTCIYDKFVSKGIVGDVTWYFNHDADGLNAVTRWNQKRKEINFGNIAVIMIIESDDEAIEFDRLPFVKKLGIYYKDMGLDSVMYCSEWAEPQLRLKYGFRWEVYVNHNFDDLMKENVSRVNWIKFLNGDKNYIRY